MCCTVSGLADYTVCCSKTCLPRVLSIAMVVVTMMMGMVVLVVTVLKTTTLDGDNGIIVVWPSHFCGLADALTGAHGLHCTFNPWPVLHQRLEITTSSSISAGHV